MYGYDVQYKTLAAFHFNKEFKYIHTHKQTVEQLVQMLDISINRWRWVSINERLWHASWGMTRNDRTDALLVFLAIWPGYFMVLWVILNKLNAIPIEGKGRQRGESDKMRGSNCSSEDVLLWRRRRSVSDKGSVMIWLSWGEEGTSALHKENPCDKEENSDPYITMTRGYARVDVAEEARKQRRCATLNEEGMKKSVTDCLWSSADAIGSYMSVEPMIRANRWWDAACFLLNDILNDRCLRWTR